MQKEWVILNSNPNPEEDVILSILKNRNIKNPVHFLKPKPSDFLPYTDILNIEIAAEKVLKAVKENKRIHIFGDIDVDGLMSMVQALRYLSNFTGNLTYSLNEKKKHGLEHQDLESYIGQYDMVIAVDSSSEDYKSQKFLSENNIEVIVIDHHDMDKEDPKYATILNCNLGSYLNRKLSGSAMVFKFIKYLDKLQGTEFAEEYWDLAATGLIGDMMPIGEENKENRYICTKGFSLLNNIALKEIIGNYTFNGTGISFSIAPLVNAAMRLNRSGIAAKLFLQDDKKACKKLIKELQELKEIQNIQKDILVTKLNKVIEDNKLNDKKVIGLMVEDNTSDDMADIIGLSANVLAAQYGKIFIIVHKTDKPGLLRGSCRCVGIENFRNIVNQSGLVTFAQGHQPAFGIGLYESNWEKLIIDLNVAMEDIELKVVSSADIILTPDNLTNKLIKKIEYVNMISGMGFKPISVVIENLEPDKVSTMKEGIHSKFEAENMEFIQWRSDLANRLYCDKGIYKTLNVIGVPQIGNFMGRKTRQLIVSDSIIESHLEFFR